MKYKTDDSSCNGEKNQALKLSEYKAKISKAGGRKRSRALLLKVLACKARR